jgi:prepilin-type N-terminal cleavage/methylation domain-containing protein
LIKKLIKANDQSGFVLIEMLMAIAISALVLVGIVEITVQTVIVHAADTSQMRAVKQVENAIHWIERDAQMASAKWISPKDSTVTAFPLYLQWTGFEDNYTHKITYVLDSGALRREEVIEDINDVISETETFICDNIIESESNYAFDGEILEVNLQATVSDFRSATESRTLYVIPRVSN